MAGPDRLAAPDVTAAPDLMVEMPPGPGDPRPRARPRLGPLAERPEKFDFFAALRLVEAAFPEAARLGEARRARDEPMRLSQPPHLAFPPAQIAGFDPGKDRRPPRLGTYVFGLFGPQGPLPLHVTQHALARSRWHRDPAFAAFCDIFQHRMLAFFYRAWATARPAVELDRPGRDRFAKRLGAIAGLASPAFLGRSDLPDRFPMFTAGLLAAQHRPPEALQRLVALFFHVPVAVREFVGAWLDIPPPARTRLGLEDGASRLGMDAVVGTRSFARHHRVRLVLGPLDLSTFLRFLPIGQAMPKLKALVRHAVGLELDWDLQLVLRKAEVPPARLDGGTRLGWTSWLATAERARDADDLVLIGGA
jgi:type VI secretion system protein ImpH